MTTRRLEAAVMSNRRVREGVFLMELEAPGMAAAAKPGQFVMVRPSQGTAPLLPRPFSIHRRRDGSLSILYRVAGSGTKLMTGLAQGARLGIFGPLGRGFRYKSSIKHPILVAGGMGIAPMPFLASELASLGQTPKLLYGCRTRPELVGLPGLRAAKATDDGSCGRRGPVTSLLEEELAVRRDSLVYACGPWAMLRRTALSCGKHGVPCQVSLESRMACGVGACQGCAVRGADGGYLSVCSDGPVFDSRLIDWDQEPPV